MPDKQESPISKFFAINSKPTEATFPELPTLIVWFRFVLAIAYGTWLGFSGSQRSSGANLIFGLNFVTFVPVVYCATFLGADQDSYNNRLLFAGVFNAVALLLLIWIYLYTVDHEADEKILAAALTGVISDTAESVSSGEDADIIGQTVTEESEF